MDIDKLTSVAHKIIFGLESALDLLISLNSQITDEQRLSVWCWHTALTALARDISDDTLTSCLNGSLRAARILNRSVLEYAARIHYYTSMPEEAENDTADLQAMVRRIVKPVAQSSGTDVELAFMRQFYSSGTTRAKQPLTDRMLAALVNNLTSDKEQRKLGFNFLEAEYSLATAYAHGSQAYFLDAFGMDDQGTKDLNRHSRSLKRESEVLRLCSSLISILVGLELFHQMDFSAKVFSKLLAELRPYPRLTTLAQHNALLRLLGIE